MSFKNYIVLNAIALLIEFRQYVKLLAIKVKEILVKAYNSISKVKRYYILLRHLYKIL